LKKEGELLLNGALGSVLLKYNQEIKTLNIGQHFQFFRISNQNLDSITHYLKEHSNNILCVLNS